mmetsp:Transcript_131557/g.196056  ORF Transcript_131557/g.196056 Transcript_131557/m.196056 type:complete len:210 (+) Transcript_131557:835-1464(+)
MVVRERMMRPVLLEPEPPAASDEVSPEAEHIVNPRLPGSGAVVCIVLDVQADKRLRNTVDNREQKGRFGRHPEVLQTEEEGNVKCTPKIPTGSSKFTSSAHDLEHFLFDLPFEWRIKFVLSIVVGNFPNTLHFLQVLGGVVRVDHLVLNCDIVSSKDKYRLAAGMVKILNIVNDSVNCYLISSKGFQSPNFVRRLRRGIIVGVRLLALT